MAPIIKNQQRRRPRIVRGGGAAGAWFYSSLPSSLYAATVAVYRSASSTPSPVSLHNSIQRHIIIYIIYILYILYIIYIIYIVNVLRICVSERISSWQ